MPVVACLLLFQETAEFAKVELTPICP